MKRIITALALVLTLVLSSVVYASATEIEPTVTIISPSITESSSVVYGDNFILSVKVASGQKLNFSIIKDTQGAEETVEYILSPVTFVSNKDINFFNSQINDVTPGVYCIVIDSLDNQDNVIETKKQYFIVDKAENKQEVSSEELFTAPTSNTLNFFRDIFKGIFGG